MARPKMDPAKKRTDRFSFRLSPEAAKRLDAYCQHTLHEKTEILEKLVLTLPDFTHTNGSRKKL